MSYKEDVEEFLSKGENLQFLLEIYKHAPSIIEKVQKEFWDGLCEAIKDRKSDFEPWEVHRKDPKKFDGEICLCQPGEDEEKSRLFYFAMGGKKLWLSISCNEGEGNINIPDVDEFIEGLKGENFKTEARLPYCPYKEFSYDLNSDEFLCEISNHDRLIDKIAQEYLSFCKKYKNEIEEINGVILKTLE